MYPLRTERHQPQLRRHCCVLQQLVLYGVRSGQLRLHLPSAGQRLSIDACDPVGLALLNFSGQTARRKPGQWLIPNDARNGTGVTAAHIDNAFLPGTGRFKADQLTADLDYNATSKDTIAFKYYYQHDPTLSSVCLFELFPGFTASNSSTPGAQVFSIINALSCSKSNLSLDADRLGFLREKIYKADERAAVWAERDPRRARQSRGRLRSMRSARPTFRESRFTTCLATSNTPGTSKSGGNFEHWASNAASKGQASNTGVFQNRIAPSARMRSGRWASTRSAFGVNYSYTQLNVTIDKRTGTGTVATDDFHDQFAQGFVTSGQLGDRLCYVSYDISMQGNASRYYRANQTWERMCRTSSR